MLAKVGEGAIFALWTSGGAYLSAKPHNAMAKIRALTGCNKLGENFLHLKGVFLALGIHSKPAANSDAMSVRHHRVLAEDVTKEQICDLSTYAREL